MKLKKTIFIKIKAEFGSKFQFESASKTLAVIMESWTQFYSFSHKKNKVEYELVERDSDKIFGIVFVDSANKKND